MDTKRIKRGLWAAPCLAVAMAFAAPAQAVTIYALTDDNVVAAPAAEDNNLISFDSATPVTLLSGPTAITGITDAATGEKVLSIDFRPSDGKLYAVTDFDKVYTIDPVSGAATAVNAAAFVPGTINPRHGMDFNPVSDAARILGIPQNLRLTVPLTPGAVTSTADTDLAYATGDPNFGTASNIASAGYTNNDNDIATATTLYAIDRGLSVLARVGGPDGVPSPNGGELTTIGALGVTPTSFNVGLDIYTVAGVNTAYAAFTDTATADTNLYTVDLATGAATSVGFIGDGTTQVAGLAVALPASSTGTVQFSAANYPPVTEAVGNATVTVTRTGGTSGEATVSFATSNGTALSSSDYTTTATTVTFADGEGGSKTVDVPIIDDTASEPSETVNLTLSDPTGATLGTQSTATITIAASDRGFGSGGGCSLSPTSNGAPDPVLPVMTLVAGLYLLRRRLGWKV